MAGKNVHEFTDGNFQSEVIGANVPVLVDFWAVWCGPCKPLGKTVEVLADEYAGRFKVGKVNIDDNGALASKFGITAVPTLLVFHNGEVVDRLVGNVPKDRVAAMLDSHL